MRDIFAVQSEIAGTVRRASRRSYARRSGPPAAPANSVALGGTPSADAYDAYLRGRALYDLSADEASERAALAQFDAAIAADPDFAAAHAARARSLTAIANQYGGAGQLSEIYTADRSGAARDRDRPRAGRRLLDAGIYVVPGAAGRARGARPFERSRELGPGEATVQARYAQYRRARPRAAKRPRRWRALLLDPLNPLIHRAAGLNRVRGT